MVSLHLCLSEGKRHLHHIFFILLPFLPDTAMCIPTCMPGHMQICNSVSIFNYALNSSPSNYTPTNMLPLRIIELVR